MKFYKIIDEKKKFNVPVEKTFENEFTKKKILEI